MSVPLTQPVVPMAAQIVVSAAARAMLLRTISRERLPSVAGSSILLGT